MSKFGFKSARRKKGDIIKGRRAEKKKQRKIFKKITSEIKWHDCSDGFICDANILEEHYRFASRAVKEFQAYLIGHRALVPYNGNWPEEGAVKKLAEAGSCVVYRFYDTKWRQDVAFVLDRSAIPHLDNMVKEYCMQLGEQNDK